MDTERASGKISEYLPIENRILEIAIALTLFIKDRNIPVHSYTFRSPEKEQVIDSAETFNAFYRTMSSTVFEKNPDRPDVIGAFSANKEIYSKRIVIIVTSTADNAVREFAKSLNRGNTDVVIYCVKKIAPGTSETEAFFHTKLITVPAEGGLNEIL